MQQKIMNKKLVRMWINVNKLWLEWWDNSYICCLEETPKHVGADSWNIYKEKRCKQILTKSKLVKLHSNITDFKANAVIKDKWYIIIKGSSEKYEF